MVGVDMSLKIEENFGKSSVREILNDFSTYRFFETYSKIANNYKYSEQALSILRELKQRVEEIYWSDVECAKYRWFDAVPLTREAANPLVAEEKDESSFDYGL